MAAGSQITGRPPFLQARTRDLFLSNAVRMHRRLRAGLIDVELNVFEAMPHGGFGGAPEDLEMREEVRRFIGRIRSLNSASLQVRRPSAHCLTAK